MPRLPVTGHYVVCRICRAHRNKIEYSHLRMHGLTLQKYIEQFPNAKLMTDAVRERSFGNIDKRGKTWEEYYGEKVAHKKKIKTGRASRINWHDPNYGCNKLEYHKGLSDRMTKMRADPNSPYNTKQWKEKQSIYRIKLWKDPNSKLNTPEVREKVIASLIGRVVSEETRKKFSKIRTDQWATPNSIYRSQEYLDKLAKVQKKRILENPESSPNRILAGRGRSKEDISYPQSRLYEIVVALFPKYHVEFNFPVNTGATVRYIDVALVNNKVGFEYDEPYWHNEEKDRIRDEELKNTGWTISHFRGLASLDKLEELIKCN